MNLYIRIDDSGNPVEHPIAEDNILVAFPGIDINNLPPWLAKFERVSRPYNASMYEKEYVTYEKVGEGYKDVWHTVSMSEEEKLEVNRSMDRELEFVKQKIRDQAQTIFNTSKSSQEIYVWNCYLKDVEAVKIENYETFSFGSLPPAPTKTPEGRIISNYNMGTKPDVIE